MGKQLMKIQNQPRSYISMGIIGKQVKSMEMVGRDVLLTLSSMFSEGVSQWKIIVMIRN